MDWNWNDGCCDITLAAFAILNGRNAVLDMIAALPFHVLMLRVGPARIRMLQWRGKAIPSSLSSAEDRRFHCGLMPF